MAEQTSEEIRAILDDLMGRKIAIDAQVADAKRAFAAGGRASDPEWLNRAERAQRMTGRDIHYWQGELARVRKAEKAANAEKMERNFIEQARRLLPPETFMTIMSAAQGVRP
jgi:hypothetical protein